MTALLLHGAKINAAYIQASKSQETVASFCVKRIPHHPYHPHTKLALSPIPDITKDNSDMSILAHYPDSMLNSVTGVIILVQCPS